MILLIVIAVWCKMCLLEAGLVGSNHLVEEEVPIVLSVLNCDFDTLDKGKLLVDRRWVGIEVVLLRSNLGWTS